MRKSGGGYVVINIKGLNNRSLNETHNGLLLPVCIPWTISPFMDSFE